MITFRLILNECTLHGSMSDVIFLLVDCKKTLPFPQANTILAQTCYDSRLTLHVTPMLSYFFFLIISNNILCDFFE